MRFLLLIVVLWLTSCPAAVSGHQTPGAAPEKQDVNDDKNKDPRLTTKMKWRLLRGQSYENGLEENEPVVGIVDDGAAEETLDRELHYSFKNNWYSVDRYKSSKGSKGASRDSSSNDRERREKFGPKQNKYYNRYYGCGDRDKQPKWYHGWHRWYWGYYNYYDNDNQRQPTPSSRPVTLAVPSPTPKPIPVLLPTDPPNVTPPPTSTSSSLTNAPTASPTAAPTATPTATATPTVGDNSGGPGTPAPTVEGAATTAPSIEGVTTPSPATSEPTVNVDGASICGGQFVGFASCVARNSDACGACDSASPGDLQAGVDCENFDAWLLRNIECCSGNECGSELNQLEICKSCSSAPASSPAAAPAFPSSPTVDTDVPSISPSPADTRVPSIGGISDTTAPTVEGSSNTAAPTIDANNSLETSVPTVEDVTVAPVADGGSSETAAPVVIDETQAPVVALDETASPVVEGSETLAPVVVDATQAPVVESSETLQPVADETLQPVLADETASPVAEGTLQPVNVGDDSIGEVPTIAPIASSVEISPAASPFSPVLSPAFSPAFSPVESPSDTLAPVAGAAALSGEALLPEEGQNGDEILPVDLTPEPQDGEAYTILPVSPYAGHGDAPPKGDSYTPFPSAAPY